MDPYVLLFMIYVIIYEKIYIIYLYYTYIFHNIK